MNRLKGGSARFRGVALTVLASALFGVMPSLALNAYKGGINVLTMLSLKHLLVAAILLPFSTFRGGLRKVRRATAARLLMAGGVLYAAQAVLYAYAVTMMPVSFAALLLFTYPVMVGLISTCAGTERLGVRRFGLLLAAFASMTLVFSGSGASIRWTGVALVLLAALSYAVYVVLLGGWTRDVPSVCTNALVNAGAALSVSLVTLASGNFTAHFAPITWGYILFNALIVGVVAYVMWFVGLKTLGAVETAVISMTEPVFAAVGSFALLGQQMSFQSMAGGLLLLACVTLFLLSKPPIRNAGRRSPGVNA